MGNGFYSALQKRWQLNDGNSLFWTKSWKPPIIAQYDAQQGVTKKINSSIISKDAINKFREIIPLARMFPLAVIHTPSSPFSMLVSEGAQNFYVFQSQNLTANQHWWKGRKEEHIWCFMK